MLRLYKCIFTICFIILGASLAHADKPKPTDFFEIKVSNNVCVVSTPCTFSVQVVAKKGFKWNEEFPAKLVFQVLPTEVKMEKKVFRQIPTKDNWQDGVRVLAQAGTIGEYMFMGTMKFSICKKNECRLWRNYPVTVQLVVNDKQDQKKER